MSWGIEIEFLFYVVLTVSALAALRVRNLIAASVTLTIFSYTGALLMLALGAVDVAFTEAVVGAGLVGVFYILVVFRTSQRSAD
jgi:energy-converting hydrogenase B subunit D